MCPGKLITLLHVGFQRIVKASQMMDMKQRIIYIPEYLIIYICIIKEKNDFFVDPHRMRIYFLVGSCNDPLVRNGGTVTIYGEKVNGRFPENTQAYITCGDFAGNVTCENGGWNMPYQCRGSNNILLQI